jgi:branched-chain amino acid transport system substrate-binding protein
VTRTRAKVALSISTRISGAADTLPTYRGFVLALEEAAAQSTEFEIVWQMYDDAGDVARSAELAEQIVADPEVVGVVGPMGSSEAFANAPVFSAAGLLQVSPCASHPDLCERDYDTFHRLVANERVQGGELAKIAYGYLGAKAVTVVHDQDEFGTVVADNFTDAYRAIGGTISDRIGFDVAEYSPTVIAARMAEQPTDLYLFAVHGYEGGLISTAARDAGISQPFLGTDGMKTSFFLGGGDDRGEAYHTHSGADFRRLPTAADFRRRYVERFPEDSTYSAEAYDAAMMIVAALDRAGVADRTAVLDAFRSLGTYQGITGPISFTPTGERDGAFVSLYRVAMDGEQRLMSYIGTTAELVAETTPA